MKLHEGQPVIDKKTQAKLVKQLKKAGVGKKRAGDTSMEFKRRTDAEHTKIGRELVKALGIDKRTWVDAEIERLKKTGEADRLLALVRMVDSITPEEQYAILSEAVRAHRTFDTAPYSNMKLADVARLLDAESQRRRLNGPVVSKIIERIVTALSHTVLAVEGRPEWMRVLNQLSRAFSRILDRVPEIGGMNESLAMLHTLARVCPLSEALEVEEHAEALQFPSGYAKLVADAYDHRPMVEHEGLRSYASLREHNYEMFKRLQSRVRVEFVDYHPYQDAADMTRQIQESQVLLISKVGFAGADNGWSPFDHLAFRAVHEYVAHVGGGHEFTLLGEVDAFRRHARLVPAEAVPALFSEVVGQACYALDRNESPRPKACVLHGFDYDNLGAVDARDYGRNFA